MSSERVASSSEELDDIGFLRHSVLDTESPQDSRVAVKLKGILKQVQDDVCQELK